MPDSLSTIDLTIAGALTTASVSKLEEVPFACDLANVEATIGTAPTGSALIYDILKNGASLFGTAVATIAPKSGIDTAATSVQLEVVGNASVDFKQGAYLKLESEYVLINQVTGSPKVDGNAPVYTVSVTRAQLGSTAAAHAAGVSAYPAAVIVAGASKSVTVANPAEGNTPTFTQGDTAQLAITQVGSTVAGSDITATLLVSQR